MAAIIGFIRRELSPLAANEVCVRGVMRTTLVNDGGLPAGLPERRLYSGGAQLPALQQSRNVAVVSPIPMTTGLPQQQAGELFRRIRQMAGLSLLQLAHRLHTTAAVIDALERGDVERLPPWPETVVVVSGFTALAGVDPRPVLAAIHEGLNVKIVDASPIPAAGRRARPERPMPFAQNVAPSMRSAPKASAPRASSPRTSGRAEVASRPAAGLRQSISGAASRAQALTVKMALTTKMAPLAARASAFAKVSSLKRPLRMPVVLSLAVTVPLALIVSFGSGGSLQAAVSVLPAPLSLAVRKVEDYVLRTRAVEKNGMMWIEVDDPRSRKTGKLPSPRR